MNIVDPILFQCALQPKAAAICAPDTGIGLISYGRLAQMIDTISGQLRRFGLGSGKTAAVIIEDPIFLSAVTLALTRLGVITVSRYDERALTTVKVDALIADKVPPTAKIEQIILVDLSWTKAGGASLAATELPWSNPEDACRISLTSGTTGDPKGVIFTHRTVASRTASNEYVFGSRFPACTRIYSDLPLSTAPGFWFLIHTLWRGGTFFFPGKTFESTADAFEEYKVQCVMAAPAGLEILLRKYEHYSALQSRFDVMIVLGDVLSQSLSDRVRARMCSHLVSVYGSTEAQTAASAPAAMIRDTPGAVGFVVPNVSVEIVSEAGEPLQRGAEGIVRIKSPHGVDRYAGDTETSAKTFRDGWFYPGDRGALDAQNLLRIVGRQDALLNLGGDKINPERVERVLEGHEGVTDCAAFGAPDELGVETLWAAVVAKIEVSDSQLRSYCESNLPAQFVPSGFARVTQIPRNRMGKIDRAALPKLLGDSR
jgi:acyl-CoA synthetase (AMP-forming)/AMP-acid ligase II